METSVKWYITRGQQRIGPLDASQLKHMAMTEQLAPTEYVWKEGMAQWIPAGQVQGLFDDAAVGTASAADTPATAEHVPATQPVSGAPAAASGPTATSSLASSATEPGHPGVVSHGATLTGGATSAGTIAATHFGPTGVHSPALKTRTSTIGDTLVPMLAGLLMLATLALPWERIPEWTHGPVKMTYGWTEVSNAFKTGEAAKGVWLIASWVVAALAILSALIMRGGGRAVGQIILGLVALICGLIVVFKAGLGDDRFKSGASELETPVNFIAACLLFAMLIVAHAIRRGGMNGPLRVITLIAAAALLIITIITFITAFAASNSLWSQYGGRRIKSPWPTWLRATLLVGHIGTILASVMILLHAIINARGRLLVTLGLVILYPVMLFTLIMDSVNTAGAFNEWDKLWTMINGTALMLGTLIILGSGFVQLIAHSRRSM